jgi:transcriptional regulator NrdR family protein
MIKFGTYLIEDKNTHLEHLEDEIINNGLTGAKTAVRFLNSLKKMLNGVGKGSTKVTVKWDGAPAVFAGQNPENGKFFVATKSLFNKTPKINYTNADIASNHGSGGLSDKLKVALKHLPKLGMKGIFQGDIMFTKEDLVEEDVDGVMSVVFTPNTISYAVPTDSKLASTIRKASIGVVWHTSYSGKTIAGLKASFGVDASKFKTTNSVWSEDAGVKNVSKVAGLKKSGIKKLDAKINQVKGAIKKAGGFFNVLAKEKTILSLGGQLKIFFNSKIREGMQLSDTKKLVIEFNKYYVDRMTKEIASKKREDTKKKFKKIQDAAMKELRKYKTEIYFAFATYLAIKEAKMIVVDQLNKIEGIGTFLKTPKGFEVTAPEGYVAINAKSGKAVKLVDRLGFSYANFTLAKDWVSG